VLEYRKTFSRSEKKVLIFKLKTSNNVYSVKLISKFFRAVSPECVALVCREKFH
jgi:hypothetical protein